MVGAAIWGSRKRDSQNTSVVNVKKAVRSCAPMKHQKVIDKIKGGSMSRAELAMLKRNAEEKSSKGDPDANEVLRAINNAKPSDSYILFMGFCPGADFKERLDTDWKARGICRFDYLESEHQLERFNTICSGDLVVLKKREQFGKTMKLYGHGRVKSVGYDENGIRYLEMDWSKQADVIEVPLMGCNSTVDIKALEIVEGEMPDEFWQWISNSPITA